MSENDSARISVSELCRRYNVDMAHARHVGRMAAGLFDLTRSLHGLAPHYGQIAYIGGLVHNVAAAQGRAKHHKRGRDILLEHPLSDVSDADRALLAVTTVFHRKRWKPEKLETEPSLNLLPPAMQGIALKLSALVRMADGLDYSHSQLTVLAGSDIDSREVGVYVAGPYAALDASRAEKKSDMWEALFQQSVSFTVRPIMAEPAEAPGIHPDDTFAQAGRKVLRVQAARMVTHQPAAALGYDPAAIHQMRVATRRMRAAMRVFEPAFDPEATSPLRRGLKQTARLLGGVRDLDVLLAGLKVYNEARPRSERSDLAPLVHIWTDQRSAAHAKLAKHLHSQAYQNFADELHAFIRQPEGRKDFTSAPVLQAAPPAIYAAYGTLRANHTMLNNPPSLDALHRTRIDAKRFRYTLEFFAEVLGSNVDSVLAAITTLQDHLGALNDAGVALARLEESDLPSDGAFGAFRADRAAALDAHVESFPAVWQDATSYETRRNLGLAVSAL